MALTQVLDSPQLYVSPRQQELEAAWENGWLTSLAFGDSIAAMDILPRRYFGSTITSVPFIAADIGLATESEMIEWYCKRLEQCLRVSTDYVLFFNTESIERKKGIYRNTDPMVEITWCRTGARYHQRKQPIFVYKCESARFNFINGMWSDTIHAQPVLKPRRSRKQKKRLAEIQRTNESLVGESPVIPEEERVFCHPYEDPVKVYFQLIRYLLNSPSKADCNALGLKEIDVGPVWDPFCGSGTSLIAAEQLHVRGAGMEIFQPYWELGTKRLREWQGQYRLGFPSSSGEVP